MAASTIRDHYYIQQMSMIQVQDVVQRLEHEPDSIFLFLFFFFSLPLLFLPLSLHPSGSYLYINYQDQFYPHFLANSVSCHGGELKAKPSAQ